MEAIGGGGGAPPAPTPAKPYATRIVKFQSILYTLRAFASHLRGLKRKCTQQWWDEFDIEELVVEGVVADVQLKCIMCENLFKALNPSQIAKTHLTERACKHRRALAAAASAATQSDASLAAPPGRGGSNSGGGPRGGGGSSGGGSSSGGASDSSSLQSGHSFLSSESDHTDLKAALAVVGLLPPTRKDLAGSLLDADPLINVIALFLIASKFFKQPLMLEQLRRVLPEWLRHKRGLPLMQLPLPERSRLHWQPPLPL
ncbi:hypothetical protein JKP88DRAFT_283820 [Tribonema minus]|uniref:DUF7963 domain-containing protein n=1 Tax=Tribonema minus TaxID=303371 RepID=A0A835YQ56_9STRA|nr:hypothetical protein JKP88DRAFT_283820 [Tribonema minus]